MILSQNWNPTAAYREASLRLLPVLEIIYHFVAQSDRPRMAIQQEALRLGFPTALRTSEAELALLNHVTRQAFSKFVAHFLIISQLPPALASKIGCGRYEPGRATDT
jgi:hypothetical protein